MSSYYTAAQLEAMRKERLKQELSDSIQKLKNQLQTEHPNLVHITPGSNIEISVFATDDVVEGCGIDDSVSIENLRHTNKQEQSRHEELDLSSLLIASAKKPTKLELELDSWIQKIDARPIISENDKIARTRLLGELARVVKDVTLDIEDKISLVKMRVESFQQGASILTAEDEKRIEDNYYEYCALCGMLEVKPVEEIPYRVENEIARMTGVLAKREEDEYVMTVIESAMKELGCHIKENAVLDHTIGQVYSVEDHSLCDVFVGRDSSGIMFEPVGESKNVSLERQRQIENDANYICSIYSELEQKVAEKGVILNRVYMDPVHLNEMCVQSDISKRESKRREKMASALKQRAVNSEG